MKKGFSIVDQGKGPQSPAPSTGPHPRSGERISYLGKTLTESGTYNGGRSHANAFWYGQRVHSILFEQPVVRIFVLHNPSIKHKNLLQNFRRNMRERRHWMLSLGCHSRALRSLSYCFDPGPLIYFLL